MVATAAPRSRCHCRCAATSPLAARRCVSRRWCRPDPSPRRAAPPSTPGCLRAGGRRRPDGSSGRRLRPRRHVERGQAVPAPADRALAPAPVASRRIGHRPQHERVQHQARGVLALRPANATRRRRAGTSRRDGSPSSGVRPLRGLTDRRRGRPARVVRSPAGPRRRRSRLALGHRVELDAGPTRPARSC